jgi:hypothetical protein
MIYDVTNIAFQLRTATTQGGLSSAPWLGPDGTNNTYYYTSGTTVSSVHDGNSWINWKAILTTNDNTKTPIVNDVNIHALSMGEIIFSKTGTNYNWISFTPILDKNGCTVDWYYSLSNNPYTWNLTSSELSGVNDIWIKAQIIGTLDSNNIRISGLTLNYTE